MYARFNIRVIIESILFVLSKCTLTVPDSLLFPVSPINKPIGRKRLVKNGSPSALFRWICRRRAFHPLFMPSHILRNEFSVFKSKRNSVGGKLNLVFCIRLSAPDISERFGGTLLICNAQCQGNKGPHVTLKFNKCPWWLKCRPGIAPCYCAG